MASLRVWPAGRAAAAALVQAIPFRRVFILVSFRARRYTADDAEFLADLAAIERQMEEHCGNIRDDTLEKKLQRWQSKLKAGSLGRWLVESMPWLAGRIRRGGASFLDLGLRGRREG